MLRACWLVYCMVVYIFPFFSIFEGKEPGRLRSKKLNGYFIASMDMDTSGLRKSVLISK